MQQFFKINYIVTDIEGTTSSKDFVYKILFPYSKKELPNFIESSCNTKIINDAMKNHNVSNRDDLLNLLLNFISEDKKDPWLKKIQGLIWQEGYERGVLKSHFYLDAVASLREWKNKSFNISIYSSGSVLAQKLLFTYSEQGNLTQLIDHYFDTEIGAKKESKSYVNMSKILECNNLSKILFLSDIEEELIAANEAGFQVCLIDRDELSNKKSLFPRVSSFYDILISRN